jgi:hypothetical protein
MVPMPALDPYTELLTQSNADDPRIDPSAGEVIMSLATAGEQERAAALFLLAGIKAGRVVGLFDVADSRSRLNTLTEQPVSAYRSDDGKWLLLLRFDTEKVLDEVARDQLVRQVRHTADLIVEFFDEQPVALGDRTAAARETDWGCALICAACALGLESACAACTACTGGGPEAPTDPVIVSQ